MPFYLEFDLLLKEIPDRVRDCDRGVGRQGLVGEDPTSAFFTSGPEHTQPQTHFQAPIIHTHSPQAHINTERQRTLPLWLSITAYRVR